MKSAVKEQVLNAGLLVFINHLGVFVFPAILPFVINEFNPDLQTEKIGLPSGCLSSIFYFGNVTSTFFWYLLSDAWGRRPVIIFGLSVSLICELLFGYSINYVMAVVVFFSWGTLNGSYGISKIFFAEVCTGTSHRHKFAILSGTAKVMGITLGAFLARPAIKYNVLQFQFYCSFPFSFLYVLTAAITLLVLIGATVISGALLGSGVASVSNTGSIFLKETNIPCQNCEDSPGEEEYLLEETNETKKFVVGGIFPLTSTSSIENSLIADPSFLQHDPTLCSRCQECMNDIASTQEEEFKNCCCCLFKCQSRQLVRSRCCQTWYSSSQDKLRHTLMSLWSKHAILSLILIGSTSLLYLVTLDLFPLLMINDHNNGGYNLDEREIGLFMIIAAAVEVTFISLVFFKLVRYTGCVWMFCISMLVFAVSSVLFPFSNTFTGPIFQPETGSGSGDINDTAIVLDFCGNELNTLSSVNENSILRIPLIVWVVVGSIFSVQTLSRSVAVVCALVMLDNTLQSSANHNMTITIVDMIVSTGQSLGILVGTTIFALSQGNGFLWPFNYHFIYMFSAVLAVGLICISVAMSGEKWGKKNNKERKKKTNKKRPKRRVQYAIN